MVARPRHRRRARSEAPDYVLLLPGAAAAGGDGPRHRAGHRGEADDRRPGRGRRLRAGGWTFNGTVPGPVIRVKVGDTIRVHLVNPAKSQVGHSIDFHASQVAWNDEMTTINPGEEKIYEWTPSMPASGCTTAARHRRCTTSPTACTGWSSSSRPRVSGRRRRGRAGPERVVPGRRASRPASRRPRPLPSPDYVVFNGVANQYLDHPIAVGTGERVRIFVLNAGAEHRQLVPRGGHDLQPRDQRRRPAEPWQPGQLRVAGGWTCHRPRARSSRWHAPRTGCTRW